MLIDMWAVWCRSACNQPTNQMCGASGVTFRDILIMMTAMCSTRCRRACTPTFTFQHIHTTSDQFKNVRESRERKQEVSIVFESFREFSRSYTTPVLDRRLQKFLFELRVVQGRTFRVRHASECLVSSCADSLPDQQCDTCVLGVTRQGRLRKHVPTQLGREFAARKVARVCPYSAGQRGCIKHALYGEVARKHAPSCDTILGLHVSSLDVLARVPLWLRETLLGDRVAWKLDVRSTGSTFAFPFVKRTRYLALARHVALPDHGVGLDGQSCSCLIVGWPVGLSSLTLSVGRPLVMFLFDCWPVGRPMPRTMNNRGASQGRQWGWLSRDGRAYGDSEQGFSTGGRMDHRDMSQHYGNLFSTSRGHSQSPLPERCGRWIIGVQVKVGSGDGRQGMVDHMGIQNKGFLLGSEWITEI
ncbi:hypothetical protein F2Q70_00003164 [Brassica cretica]|uniref:Uncharacterized protein n=1 Tax=Brassica cretica TaxID=69181 RepID=A0A8S9IU80_BRACR|nr:hypothetical protein F2Q70_00003164 [Brassica cretica]